MSSFAAILGHQPHISLAELRATFKDFKLERMVGKNLVLFESAEKIDAAFLNRLGGTIAIAEEITERGTGSEQIPHILAQQVAGIKGQIIFSLRGMNVSEKMMKELYRSSKEYLRSSGRHSRYVGSPTKAAASVLLHDAGIVDGSHGCELFLINIANKDEDLLLWIGRTRAAQDIEAYAKRDMGKPVRDTKSGLLPPKLAQVLLNFGFWLAGSGERIADSKEEEKEFIVYDPFCGTGVIPMECLLRGWPVLASDVSQKAVSGTEKNLEWLRKERGILKKDVPSAVWKHDAKKPFDFSDAKAAGIRTLPNVIVTETSLGENFEERPSIKAVATSKSEIEKLEAAFLETASKSLPGVSIVCTWPVWYHSKDQVCLEKIWDHLHELGYQATLPPGSEPEIPGRLSLLYRRPDQFVGREIVLLRSRK